MRLTNVTPLPSGGENNQLVEPVTYMYLYVLCTSPVLGQDTDKIVMELGRFEDWLANRHLTRHWLQSLHRFNFRKVWESELTKSLIFG